MIKKVEHVALIVKDIKASIEYYSSIFDFELRTRGENANKYMAFLAHKNQKDFEIELIQDKDPNANYAEVGVVNHLAFTVENIDESIEYYKQKGIVFKTDEAKPPYPGAARTIFFDGPSKEILQLVEPVKK
jgi:lactoylglutathione lyase